jgi:hypothetical protein
LFLHVSVACNSNTEFPLGSGNLLSLCGRRRQAAIGRIDDPRRARAGALERREQRVVGASDIRFGPALRALVSADQPRSHSIHLGSLCLGKEFLVREPGRALQRRVGLVGPDALQIGFTPGRFQRWGRRQHRAGRRRNLSLQVCDGCRYGGADTSRGNGDHRHRA